MADSESINKSYKDFIAYVRRRGASLNNQFQVEYNLSDRLSEHIKGLLDRSPVDILDDFSFMIENVEIPPIAMATGEYRYNNSPQFKYPYAKIYNQVTITYILDASFIQRKLFDVWADYIYNISGRRNDSLDSDQNLRIPYKDDYVARNITILKYDRCFGGGRNDPDAPQVPHSSYTLVNAFPVNISSVPLSNAASDISRVSIAFEYDLMRENANYNGTSRTPLSTSFNP